MTYSFVPWTSAKRCTSGPRPGAVALMKVALGRHPRGRSLGIYNCRSVRGGSTTSKHGEGRALDIGFPMTSSGRGSAAGYALVEELGKHGRKLGIEVLIYDRKIWSAKTPGGRAYTGSAPHYDHVHVELSNSAADGLTTSKIEAILGGSAVDKRKSKRIRKHRGAIKRLVARIKKLRSKVANRRKRIRGLKRR